ncbi:MAG: 5-formyltetrahydrofolate cyclo-ligase [Alphaproteobacteria bacterium]|nr:5-formyltetrahydrofolate cyclo-ligase [Alphaproteobacteria bacterium]
MTKKTVREKARALRREAAAAADPQAAARLAAHFLDRVPWRKGMAVGGYWPIAEEIDPRPLLSALDRAGCACALPIVAAPGEALAFRAWRPGFPMEPGAYGIPVPAAKSPAQVPELLLVPLLAFDRFGHRLGYGGGYYDRTLQALRGQGTVLSVGLAYAAQEMPAVPRDAGDEALEWVVTEREAIRIEAAAKTEETEEG